MIADDHSLFRDGLRKLLEAERDLAVAGEARDGEEAIRLVQQLQPDVLLLAHDLPRKAGPLTLQSVQATAASVRTIVLASGIDRGEIVGALQLGARGVVTKAATADLLLDAIRAVMTGQYWNGDGRSADLVETMRTLMAEAPLVSFGLTRRQLMIVALVAAGRTNRQIAERLSVSEYTVKHYLTAIFSKLGVSSRLALAQFAAHHRLRDRV